MNVSPLRERHIGTNLILSICRIVNIGRNGDKVSYGGIALKKVFTSRAAAIKAAYHVYHHFLANQKERGEHKQLKVTLHKQYLLHPSEEILTLYEGKVINGELLK